MSDSEQVADEGSLAITTMPPTSSAGGLITDNPIARETPPTEDPHKAFIEGQMLHFNAESQAQLEKHHEDYNLRAYMLKIGLTSKQHKNKRGRSEERQTKARPPKCSHRASPKAIPSASSTCDVRQSSAGASSNPASSQPASSNVDDAPLPVPSNAEAPGPFDSFEYGEAMEIEQGAVSTGAQGREFTAEPHLTDAEVSTLTDPQNDFDFFAPDEFNFFQDENQTNASGATANALPRNPNMGDDLDFEAELPEDDKQTNLFDTTLHALSRDMKLPEQLPPSHTTVSDAGVEIDGFGFSTANEPTAYNNIGSTDRYPSAMDATPHQRYVGNANTPLHMPAPIVNADTDTNFVPINNAFPRPAPYPPFGEMHLYNGAVPLQHQHTTARIITPQPAAPAIHFNVHTQHAPTTYGPMDHHRPPTFAPHAPAVYGPMEPHPPAPPAPQHARHAAAPRIDPDIPAYVDMGTLIRPQNHRGFNVQTHFGGRTIPHPHPPPPGPHALDMAMQDVDRGGTIDFVCSYDPRTGELVSRQRVIRRD